MASEGKNVLVTGGSGFIGLHIVNDLLESGYKVNTTTRSLKSESAAPLVALKKKYADALNIFEADLLQPNAYKGAIQGVTAVLHVASPIILDATNTNKEELLKPAIEGTKNVLQSCLNSTTVKTIIVTSSGITIRDFDKPPSYTFTEKDFSSHDKPDDIPYFRSKVLAEREVWEFNKLHSQRFRIVTVHPTLVLGPDLDIENVSQNKRSNIGKTRILEIIDGIAKDLQTGVDSTVDVRDVSTAHIRVLSNPNATGRFIIFNRAISKIELAKKISELAPNVTIKSDILSLSIPEYNPNQMDNTKSKQILGMEYRSLDTTLKDILKQMYSS